MSLSARGVKMAQIRSFALARGILSTIYGSNVHALGLFVGLWMWSAHGEHPELY